MTRRSLQMTTAAITLAAILPILGLENASGDFAKGNWGELVFATLFLFAPSLVLARLGYRPTNSKTLSIILFVCAIVSTVVWILFALAFVSAGAVDAQSGLAVLFAFAIQLFIAAIAIISFLLLRKKS